MGVRGCGLPEFCARSGSAATNPREWPRPRPGMDIVIRRAKNVQTWSARCSTYRDGAECRVECCAPAGTHQMRQSLGVVGILRFVIGNSHIRHRLPIFMFHDDDVVFWQGPPLGPPRSQSSARFAVAPSGMDTAPEWVCFVISV
jgi:hypothetical protein